MRVTISNVSVRLSEMHSLPEDIGSLPSALEPTCAGRARDNGHARQAVAQDNVSQMLHSDCHSIMAFRRQEETIEFHISQKQDVFAVQQSLGESYVLCDTVRDRSRTASSLRCR